MKNTCFVVEMCWAIEVIELIRALRQIDGHDTYVNEKHYCYLLKLTKGFVYVMKNGIQREEKPFIGCSRDVLIRITMLLR